MTRDFTWRVLTQAQWRTYFPFVLAGLIAVAAIVLLGRELRHHLHGIEDWIGQLGPIGYVAYVVLFVVTSSVLVPESLLTVTAGVLFGWTWGVIVVTAGYLLACALQFALARRFIHDFVERLVSARPSWVAIHRTLRHDAVRLQALVRLTPLSPASMSYLFGAAGVGFDGFMLASLVRLPSICAEVYFGYAGKHMVHVAGRPTGALYLHDVFILAVALACVAAMYVASQLARKAIIKAMAEVENGGVADGT